MEDQRALTFQDQLTSRVRSRQGRGAIAKAASRRDVRLIRIIVLVLLVGTVAVPNLVSIVFFGLLASDQFASEAKFTVRAQVDRPRCRASNQGMKTNGGPELIECSESA